MPHIKNPQSWATAGFLIKREVYKTKSLYMNAIVLQFLQYIFCFAQ
jgi:hypothetical protein